MYDPVEHPQAATARRNTVLQQMLDMKAITQAQYDKSIRQSLPAEDDIDPPNSESQQPYFTSWMTEHLLSRFRPGKVFAGGLKVKTTIDPELQQAAESAIVGRLAGVGPDAALVAIKNSTGEVRAMVGGSDFNSRPFNLATNGHRQPGSAFKPFILVRALEDGIDPNSSWASQPKTLYSKNGHGQKVRFDVSNYEDSYLGDRVALVGHGELGQLRLRRARHEGEAASRGGAGAETWASAPRSPPTRRCCSAA